MNAAELTTERAGNPSAPEEGKLTGAHGDASVIDPGAAAAISPLSGEAGQGGGPRAGDFLRSTEYLDIHHPGVRAIARQLAADGGSDRAIAVRIHDFVRDEIVFGWTPGFYTLKASAVLAARVGYCMTKTTLFVALLRACGIPARQRFVTIRSEILAPFLTLPYPYVDHAYGEVQLDGRWVGLDSYVVDTAMFDSARYRLRAESRSLGYGMHVDAQRRWDGECGQFSQLVDNGRVPHLTSRDYGVFADAGAFYACGDRSESLTGLRALLLPMLIRSANRGVVDFRTPRSAPQLPPSGTETQRR